MNTQVKAIYVDGVFKPLEPIQLHEKQEVFLSITDGEEVNLAGLAANLFGENGTDIPSHPPVELRNPFSSSE